MDESKYMRSIVNSLQKSIIIIDQDYRILDVNDVTCSKYKIEREEIVGKYCYDITHHFKEPCFKKDIECPVRVVFETGQAARVIHKHFLHDGTHRWEEIIASPLKNENGKITHVIEEIRDPGELLKNQKIVEELKSEVQTLRGMLPICANCKKIRNDHGFWESVEEYIIKNSEAIFTHGLGPECAEGLYPDYYKRP